MTAVDVEATLYTTFGENRFDERFVDLDFKPGPEVLKYVKLLWKSIYSCCYYVMKAVGAQHRDCVWVRAADLQGPDRTPKLFDKVYRLYSILPAC